MICGNAFDGTSGLVSGGHTVDPVGVAGLRGSKSAVHPNLLPRRGAQSLCVMGVETTEFDIFITTQIVYYSQF